MKQVQFHKVPDAFIYEHHQSLSRWLRDDPPPYVMGFTTKYGELDLIRRDTDTEIYVKAEREVDQHILNKFLDS